MAENICSELKSGNYKTVRLSDGKIRLFVGEKYYTFKERDIRRAQINSISDLYPYDLSPITETFVNNGKVYYIRDNKAVVYNGEVVTEYNWKPLDSKERVARLIIRRKGEITAFFVPPKSSRDGSVGQSMSSSNDIQVTAFGVSSSVSISNFNGIYRIVYNGWRIPVHFNAFLVNTDDTLIFFNEDKYCVTAKNSNSNLEWKDINTLFGC